MVGVVRVVGMVGVVLWEVGGGVDGGEGVRRPWLFCMLYSPPPSISQVKSSETNRRVLSVLRKYNCFYSCLEGGGD